MTITRMTMMTMTAAMTTWMAGAAPRASQPQRKVIAYVQASATVPNEVQIPAQRLASQIFAGIGVNLEWSTGKPVRSSAEWLVVVELVTCTPPDLKPGALAYALPYEGVHIRVFFDRIAPGPAPDRARLLAYVMVHEITHLLEGLNRHSDSGVMKAHWTDADLYEMRYNPCVFAAEDVALIYSGLSARQAGTPVAGLGDGR
jgi:hypothetical protein